MTALAMPDDDPTRTAALRAVRGGMRRASDAIVPPKPQAVRDERAGRTRLHARFVAFWLQLLDQAVDGRVLTEFVAMVERWKREMLQRGLAHPCPDVRDTAWRLWQATHPED